MLDDILGEARGEVCVEGDVEADVKVHERVQESTLGADLEVEGSQTAVVGEDSWTVVNMVAGGLVDD